MPEGVTVQIAKAVLTPCFMKMFYVGSIKT